MDRRQLLTMAILMVFIGMKKQRQLGFATVVQATDRISTPGEYRGASLLGIVRWELFAGGPGR